MRAIDADLIDMFECHPTDWATGAIDPQEAQDIIDNAPTLEVEPVRYGHWITFLDGEDDGVFCSECKEDLLELFPCVDEDRLPRRCPFCGAKMRKDDIE